MDSRKRQTSTVTPAQPGDFPLWFKLGLFGKILFAGYERDFVTALYFTDSTD